MEKDYLNYTHDDFVEDIRILANHGINPDDIDNIPTNNELLRKSFFRQYYYRQGIPFNEDGKIISMETNSTYYSDYYTDDDYLKDVLLVTSHGINPDDFDNIRKINNLLVSKAFLRQYYHARNIPFDENGKRIEIPKETNLIKKIIIIFFILAFLIAAIRHSYFNDKNNESNNDDTSVEEVEEVNTNDPYALNFDRVNIRQLSKDYYDKKKEPYNTTFGEDILYTTSPSKNYIFMLAYITIPGDSDTLYTDIRKSFLEVDIVKLNELGNYDSYTFETIYHEDYPDYNQVTQKNNNSSNNPGKEKFQQIIYEKFPSIELENDVYKYSTYGGIKIYNE